MKTYQEFATEAHNREYDRRGPRPVRGRDYEDFKGLPKPSGDLGGKFQGGWLKKKEEKKSKLPESAVPGKPAEKLGAVTAIPKDERQAALERIKAKTAAIRKKKGIVEDAELEEGIGMTMAGALGNPPALSKRMKLKQALIINKIRSDAKKNKEKKYSGKAKKE